MPRKLWRYKTQTECTLVHVSIVTLRVATTRYCQTDRVSGGIYHPIYLTNTNEKGERQGSKNLQQARMTLAGKLHDL